MIDIDISIRGNAQVEAAVKILRRKISEKAALRKIARPDAKVVAAGMRAAQFAAEGSKYNTPKKIHYSYAGKKRKSQFIPGHLEKSIREIGEDKRLYRKFSELYVGPIYTRKAGGGGSFTGRKGKADAYYAHMMFGSAKAYESRVIQKGFDSVKSIAGALVLKEAEKVINKEAKKAGLR